MANSSQTEKALWLACLDLEKARAEAFGARVDNSMVDRLFEEYMDEASRPEAIK